MEHWEGVVVSQLRRPMFSLPHNLLPALPGTGHPPDLHSVLIHPAPCASAPRARTHLPLPQRGPAQPCCPRRGAWSVHCLPAVRLSLSSTTLPRLAPINHHPRRIATSRSHGSRGEVRRREAPDHRELLHQEGRRWLASVYALNSSRRPHRPANLLLFY